MPNPYDRPFRPYVTRSGRELTDEDIEALSEEAEEGYDVSQLTPITRPYTILIEVTLDFPSHQAALEEGEKMLEHVISGWDGAAGAVVGLVQGIR